MERNVQAKRRAMMDEDEDFSIQPPKRVKSSLKPSPSKPEMPPPTTPTRKLKVHFAGRVYRPLSDTSPSKARSSYSSGADFLGQPDELISHPKAPLTPQSLEKKAVQRQDNDDLEIVQTPSKKSCLKKPALLADAFSPVKQPSPRSSNNDTQLPQHYSNLLALYNSFERALTLHLATDAGSRACASAYEQSQAAEGDSFSITVPNIVSYLSIKETVERGSGLRFGQAELARLAWLWSDPDLIASQLSEDDSESHNILPFSIHPVRVLDRATSSKVRTWGLGVAMKVKHTPRVPQYQMVGMPSSPSAKRKREGINFVSLWSSGAVSRKEEMRRRLLECVRTHHDEFVESLNTPHDPSSSPSVPQTPSKTPRKNLQASSAIGMPTPPSTRRRPRQSTSSIVFADYHSDFQLDTVPPVPCAVLPSLDSKALAKKGSASSLASSSESLSATSTAQDNTVAPTSNAISATNSAVEDLLKTPVKSTIKNRNSSLMERIKAKEMAAETRNGRRVDLSSAAESPSKRHSLKKDRHGKNAFQVERMDQLKRKSMLSRLPNVADSVYMLFAPNGPGPSSPSMSLPTPPTRRRRAIPTSEVAQLISKSSKIALSTSEAKESIDLLAELCPEYIAEKKIDRQDWIVLGGINAEAGKEAMALADVKARIRQELAS